MSQRTHEQYYAELLYATLQKELDAEIKLAGAGMHWDVLVTGPKHSCTIHCFYYDFRDYKGPEYYVWLFAKDNREATGRSRTLKETITIVSQWIKGASLLKLYHDHPFLDREKRQLEHVEALFMHYCPSLGQTAHQIIEGYFITYSLTFGKEERSCELKSVGSDTLSCNFCWDGATIFKTTEPFSESLTWLISDWVVNKAMPSALKERYPDLYLGVIAEYYEKGKGIEGEFLDSWDEMELFFDGQHHEDKMVTLIRRMREKGFDHLLRAGQSLLTLVLSRSRRHGLRNEQPCLRISIGNDAPFTMTVRNSEESHTFEKAEYNDSLDHLLQDLAVRPID